MRRPLLLICLCLVIVMAFSHYAGDSPCECFPQEETVTVTGRIDQKDDTSFYLKVQTIAAVSRQENPIIVQQKNFDKCRLICEYDRAESLPLGSVVALRGTFRQFSPATNPGEFDYERYYHSLGFVGRVQETEILGRGEPGSPIPEGLYQLRRYWKERLYRVFPEKEASVMAAVLLGDKSGLDSEIKELYQNNGVIHILSISGLHITVIGLGLYRLLRRLGMPVWLAALCGGAALTLYGIMTGLSVSACRAIGMYLLRMLALLCGRTYDMLTALGVMAVLLVWDNPGYVEHMGFLLSFGSIAGVGVLCPALTPAKEEMGPQRQRYVEGRFRKLFGQMGKRLWSGACQGFLAGLSITLTTLPIQLWFTYEVPVYSVLLNVLLLPFMGVVLAAGLVAMLAPGLGFVGTLDIIILAGYERLCILFDGLPFHTWSPGRPRVWQVALYYALWFLVAWGTGWYRRQKRRALAAVKGPAGEAVRGAAVKAAAVKAAVLVLAVLLLGVRVIREDRITFLDVGQGDCICVQLSSGEVYLFDCGSISRSRIGERVLIPFLKYSGIRHVDGIFLSHPDADHENGLIELLALGGREHITVGQVILPGIAKDRREEAFGELLAAAEAAAQKEEIRVNYVQAGDNLWRAGAGKRQPPADGGERFLCLHPGEGFPAEEPNAYSACFYLELEGGFSLLLTGDVEGAGETALLKELRERGIADVTVLKAAHHGSRHSTSGELLEQISPDLAVISCGRKNRYGHPHQETLERLAEERTLVYRTDECGAVMVRVKGGKVAVAGYIP